MLLLVVVLVVVEVVLLLVVVVALVALVLGETASAFGVGSSSLVGRAMGGGTAAATAAA